MTSLTDLILVAVVLTNFALMGMSRLSMNVRVCALQGTALGLLPLTVGEHGITIRAVIFTVLILGLKGYLFPKLLMRSIRAANARSEDVPIVGYAASMILGILILWLSFWLSSGFPLIRPAVSRLVLPLALSTILIGLFLIMSRRTAVMQVVGYLVLENGIFIFGVALAQEEPFLVELGVLLDVFVAVFVMGIAIFHINREFDHIDVDQLSSLRD